MDEASEAVDILRSGWPVLAVASGLLAPARRRCRRYRDGNSAGRCSGRLASGTCCMTVAGVETGHLAGLANGRKATTLGRLPVCFRMEEWTYALLGMASVGITGVLATSGSSSRPCSGASSQPATSRANIRNATAIIILVTPWAFALGGIPVRRVNPIPESPTSQPVPRAGRPLRHAARYRGRGPRRPLRRGAG